MSFRVTQCWPRRAVLAGALAMPLAGGLIPQQAMAQYTYDYGFGYPGPAYSYSPQAYPGYPFYQSYGQQYHRGGDWGSGGDRLDRAWNGEDWGRGDRSDARQGHGSHRRKQTRAAADLAAATVPALGRVRAAAVQARRAEPTIAGLDHTAVIDSREPTR
jgi:hypothetical protein